MKAGSQFEVDILLTKDSISDQSYYLISNAGFYLARFEQGIPYNVGDIVLQNNTKFLEKKFCFFD